MSPAIPPASSLPRLRTVFISDLHLGFRGCQAEYLLDFLERLDAEQLVLVGDIVDLWSMKRSAYWPLAHQQVLRAILRLARSGTRVVYVPGNHDDGLRELCGAEIAGIDIRRDFIHLAADGRRYLVLHGDDFDGAVQFCGALKLAGERLYDVLLWAGRGIEAVRRRLGRGHWSLASWIKHSVPDARRYIERFEHAAAYAARRHGLDGVICGHIHRPELRTVDGIAYCNDGDWVEHCSALTEDRNGRLALVRWTGCADRLGAAPPAAPGEFDALETLVASLEPDGKGVPVLLRQYRELGARVLGVNVDPAFGSAIDGPGAADLRRTDARALAKDMGRDAAQAGARAAALARRRGSRPGAASAPAAPAVVASRRGARIGGIGLPM
jgi:UDP-2,3-diacylglucosamine pyrophosphatase LpxH